MIRILPCLTAALLLAPPAAYPQDGGDPALELIPVPAYVGTDLRMRQDAWRNPQANLGPGQKVAGYKRYYYDFTRTYPVRTRIAMSTTVRLDPNEQITDAILADPSIFEITVRENGPYNVLEIRPLAFGADTSLKIYTKSKRIYSFYLVSEPHDTPTTTDFMIDFVLPSSAPTLTAADSTTGPHPDPDAKTSGARTDTGTRSDRIFDAPALPNPSRPGPAPDLGSQLALLGQAVSGDLTQPVDSLYGNLSQENFNPAELIYDLAVWASSKEAAAAIAPQRVFRDEKWTYIDYGDKAASMQRWPVPLLVTDETETPVAWRIAGKNRQVLVVEAIGDLVLRSGTFVVCLRQQHIPTGPAIETAAPAQQAPEPTTILEPPSAPDLATLRADLLVHFATDTTATQRNVVAQILNEEAPYAPLDGSIASSLDPLHANRACERIARIGVTCTVRPHTP